MQDGVKFRIGIFCAVVVMTAYAAIQAREFCMYADRLFFHCTGEICLCPMYGQGACNNGQVADAGDALRPLWLCYGTGSAVAYGANVDCGSLYFYIGNLSCSWNGETCECPSEPLDPTEFRAPIPPQTLMRPNCNVDCTINRGSSGASDIDTRSEAR
jgi:hypothetical protein